MIVSVSKASHDRISLFLFLECDFDRHCGVWMEPEKKYCRKSITCKVSIHVFYINVINCFFSHLDSFSGTTAKSTW